MSQYRRTLLCLVPMVLALVSNSACTKVAEHEAMKASQQALDTVQPFQVASGDLTLYRQCLSQRGGSCQGSASTPLPHSSQVAKGQAIQPHRLGQGHLLRSAVDALSKNHPARRAHQLLGHRITRQATALHDYLRGVADTSTSSDADHLGFRMHHEAADDQEHVHLGFHLGNVQDFSSLLFETTGADGFHHLRTLCGQLKSAPTDASPADAQDLEAECQAITFIDGYLKAYFRHGEIVAIQFGDGATQSSPLATVAPGLQQQVSQAEQKLSNVLRISPVGFVSRDTTYQAKVPSFEVPLALQDLHRLSLTDLAGRQVITQASQVETSQTLSGQLARVFLEAIFDASEGLPGLAPHNTARATGLDLGVSSLPLFQPPLGNVDHHDWNAMVRINGQVSHSIEAILKRLVAGIGPLSLNNPELEDLIVQLVTTSVRKATAKSAWCWYACDLNTASDSAAAKAVNDLETGKRLETAAQNDAARIAKDVKLHLKVLSASHIDP